MASEARQVKFSIQLIEYTDGSTACDPTGGPSIVQVLGLLELYRACYRLDGINAYSHVRDQESRKAAGVKSKKARVGR